MKHIHFHPDKPEQHNVYISNLRGNFATIYDGTDWVAKPKNLLIQHSFEDRRDNLIDSYEYYKDELPERTDYKFGKFMNKCSDKKIIEQSKKEIEAVLYNNRHIPEQQKRIMDKQNRAGKKKLIKDKAVYTI
jgi:predicted ATP-dependent Lon-type protease